MKIVKVYRVHIPPMSTMGTGYGIDEEGNHVTFGGDHRPMRYLGEAMAGHSKDDPIVVELEDWQVTKIEHYDPQTGESKDAGR